MKVFLSEILSVIQEIDNYHKDVYQGSYVWNKLKSMISIQNASILAYRFRNKQPFHPIDPIETEILNKMSINISRNEN